MCVAPCGRLDAGLRVFGRLPAHARGRPAGQRALCVSVLPPPSTRTRTRAVITYCPSSSPIKTLRGLPPNCTQLTTVLLLYFTPLFYLLPYLFGTV